MTKTKRKLLLTFVVAVVMGVLIVIAAFLSGEGQGLAVSRPEGNTMAKWPLTVDSGTIRCEWKENRPLVLFSSKEGVRGVNGAARDAGGYPPIRSIMVDRRLWPLVMPVVSEWIRAGLAMCDGDVEEAKKRIGMANVMAVEPLPPGVKHTLSTEPESVRRRRIFFEAVRCEDISMRKTNRRYESQVERLLRLGKRVEAQELTREKFKMMDEAATACKEELRQQQGLSLSEFKLILSEGLSGHWPMPGN